MIFVGSWIGLNRVLKRKWLKIKEYKIPINPKIIDNTLTKPYLPGNLKNADYSFLTTIVGYLNMAHSVRKVFSMITGMQL